MEISADMREATNNSLGKMQSLRASLARTLQSENSNASAPASINYARNGLHEPAPGYGHPSSGAGAINGHAWSSAVPASTQPPPAARREQSRPTSRASAKISDSEANYVSVMADTSLFPAAEEGQDASERAVTDADADADEIVAPDSSRNQSSTGNSKHSDRRYVEILPPAQSSSAASVQPAAQAVAVPAGAPAVSADVEHSPLSGAGAANRRAGSQVEGAAELELDLSGTWQAAAAPASGKAAPGEAASGKAASGLGAKLPLQALQRVQRDSVDLSGLSLDEVRELTGDYQ